MCRARESMEVLCQISDAVKQGCVRPREALTCIPHCVHIYTQSPEHILTRHNILQQAYAIDNLRHTAL